MNTNHDISKSLCKTCEFRFRRVFMPLNPEDFIIEGENDEEEVVEGDNIVIMNMCLAADMDLELDSTIECTHYKPIADKKVQFFKHI